MPKVAAGLILFRRGPQSPEVLLVHMGGPFWARKDLGAWSIPKGELEPDEDPLAAARREFEEETGCRISGEFRPLAPQKQRSGKTVYAWAVEGDCDPAAIKSNTVSIEWPPHSGRRQVFPEVDRAAWFPLDEAKQRILPGQLGFIESLERATQ